MAATKSTSAAALKPFIPYHAKMHELYLIRHGQAGSRDDYDRLSPLGHQQATQLGTWFSNQGILFDKIISGALRRQQETAEHLGSTIEINPQWNEFDLDAVYQSIAPQLAKVDESFGNHYQKMMQAASDPSSAVHRNWTPADFGVVRAWVTSQFEMQCETWPDFHKRILAAFAAMPDTQDSQRVALVTSATPIAITTANLLQTPESRIFPLAGEIFNSSFTLFRRRPSGWSLAGFNHTPHLEEEKLRTLR
jgi:broad specificity phosphatase PhoE